MAAVSHCVIPSQRAPVVWRLRKRGIELKVGIEIEIETELEVGIEIDMIRYRGNTISPAIITATAAIISLFATSARVR